MPFNCVALNVMLSGPGDVAPLLDIVEKVIYDWNRERSATSSIVLLPRHWSTDSRSSFSLGSDGQAEINNQLVETADIVFAVFHTKMGTQTPRAASGTAEEIEKAIDDGTPVHVFFSEEAIPYNHDSEQYEALKEFRRSLGPRGLYLTFATEDDLRGLVRKHLETDIATLGVDVAASAPAKTAAQLVARYDFREEVTTDSRGRPKTRKKGERILIRNNGTATAHDVTLEMAPVGDGEAAHLHTDTGEPPTFAAIAPGTEVGVMTALFMGAAMQQEVTLTWTDDNGTAE